MDDLSSTLSQQAILAALSSNWQQALEINEQIIESNPDNIEALNRLGRAYFELGRLNEAKKYFEKTLINDPYNQIAAKFIQRIKACNKKGGKVQKIQITEVSSDLFIEEPGKTKVITLLKVAEPQKLSLLSSGAPVQFIIKNHSIAVADLNNNYLGILPDDLSHLLTRLIRGGNKYQAFIKTIKINGISILIREVFRSSRFRNQPSFLDNCSGNSVIYSPTHLVITDSSEDEEIYPETEDEEMNLM